jgi:hypothetical protein
MLEITFTRPSGDTFALTVSIPKSYSARIDLTAELSAGKDSPARWSRLLSAGLGLALEGRAPKGKAPLPAYTGDADLVGYGGKVTDALCGRWGVVPDAEFWAQAKDVCIEIMASVPREEEVIAKRDFSSPAEGDSTTP